MKHLLKYGIMCIALNSPVGVNATNQDNREDGWNTPGITLSKSTFIAGATWVGAKLGESWAVDLTVQALQKGVKFDNQFLDWTLGSIIRNRSFQEAIPLAASRGKLIGGSAGAFFSSLTCQYIEAVYGSCYRSLRGLL